MNLITHRDLLRKPCSVCYGFLESWCTIYIETEQYKKAGLFLLCFHIYGIPFLYGNLWDVCLAHDLVISQKVLETFLFLDSTLQTNHGVLHGFIITQYILLIMDFGALYPSMRFLKKQSKQVTCVACIALKTLSLILSIYISHMTYNIWSETTVPTKRITSILNCELLWMQFTSTGTFISPYGEANLWSEDGAHPFENTSCSFREIVVEFFNPWLWQKNLSQIMQASPL